MSKSKPIDSAQRLKREIARRQAAQAALVRCRQHYRVLLRQSRLTEQKLRRFSHRVLSAQEEERKTISRELHDQIAQLLVGINTQLATLKVTASVSHVGLNQKIRNAQRMVERSVKIVHRFARELRPPVLDDLGLIPAFQAYMKSFSERTGILVRLTAFAGVEQLHSDKRTALYRVAQEALFNVARHAKATLVTVKIVKAAGAVDMRLHDNGASFDVDRVLLSRRNKRLGLIGMRERVEMVGGSFSIASSPGKGTTIGIRIPFETRKPPAP